MHTLNEFFRSLQLKEPLNLRDAYVVANLAWDAAIKSVINESMATAKHTDYEEFHKWWMQYNEDHIEPVMQSALSAWLYVKRQYANHYDSLVEENLRLKKTIAQLELTNGRSIPGHASEQSHHGSPDHRDGDGG